MDSAEVGKVRALVASAQQEARVGNSARARLLARKAAAELLKQASDSELKEKGPT